MNTPPHLPAKTCNVKTHKTFQSLGWLLFLIFVASLSSIAFTLSTLVWLTPNFIPDQIVTTIQKGEQAQAENFSLEIYNDTRRRVWEIYDKRQKIDGLFYNDAADVLQAVMFSSDGWAVIYAPDYYPGLEKFWEGINYQGVSYKIEKVFVDTVSGFAYMKFAGDGFSFISFANWDNLGEGSQVWTVSKNKITHHVLGEAMRVGESKNYFIWQPQFFYNLKGVSAGDLVINTAGELVGLIDENNNILFGWMVDDQFVSILENGLPNYLAVDWKGQLAYGFINGENFTKRVSGFYVAQSPTRSTSSTIGVGDLITHIQNKPIKGAELARQLLSAPNQFSVTVLRKSRESDLIVEKEKVK